MANIFVSYSRRSEDIAKILVRDIEALGQSAWFDQDLSGGQVWWDQILAKVRACNVFVFVLNPESLDSTACQREYRYAADLGKPILPVLVSGEVSANLLPPMLTQIQFVDYKNQDRDAVLRLARALANVPPPQALPDPLPVPPSVPMSYLGGLAQRVEAQSPLNYEEQSALLFDLKRGLRDPESANDAGTLLDRLRKRRDLLATVAEEIDDLLRNTRTKPLPPFEDSFVESAEHLEPTPSGDDHQPTWRERKKGALKLALLGVAIGLLWLGSYALRRGSPGGLTFKFVLESLWFIPWYSFVLGGAIAGVAAGIDRTGIVAARTGMAISAIVMLVLNSEFRGYVLLLATFAPPLGALIGVYITKRQARR